MDTPPKKEQKFPQSKIYRKNIKARGQKLYISKNCNKKKESATKNKSIINKYKNYNTKENSLSNISKNNILEEIKNTKNKIEQYENYLKKSFNTILPNEIKQINIISSYKKNNKLSNTLKNNDYNRSNTLDINNILNSINQKYNDYNNFNNMIKKATTPNISLINNSLILNYMNKVNNNISVKSNITSNDNSIHNSNSDIVFTPDYKKAKNVKSFFSKNKNNSKNETLSKINRGRMRINKAKNTKISKSCNKFYNSSFGKKNRTILIIQVSLPDFQISESGTIKEIEVPEKECKLVLKP